MTALLWLCLVVGVGIFGLVEPAPRPPKGPTDQCTDVTEDEAKAQLARYGYQGVPTSDRREGLRRFTDRESFSRSLSTFQRRYNIRPTGNLDRETRCLMSSRRCAREDLQTGTNRPRRQAGVAKWPYTTLTWDVRYYANQLTTTRVDQIMADALKKWQDVAGICFVRKPGSTYSNRADLDVFFASGNHDSPFGYSHSEFDGVYGVLAHAYFPTQGGSVQSYHGDAHFDKDEEWCDRGSSCGNYGIYLDWVAVHEFGHSLGLDHTDVEGAIMYPYYSDLISNLQPDDISRIQAVYGGTIKCGDSPTDAPETEAPVTEAPETEAPETEAPVTDAPETEAPETEAPVTDAPETGDCARTSVDASIYSPYGYMFTVRGNEIDKYRGEFEEFDSTSDVGTVLSPLTGQIRGAIYFDGINRFYFLTDTTVWVYEPNLDGSFDYDTSFNRQAIFPSLPDDTAVDALITMTSGRRSRNYVYVITGSNTLSYKQRRNYYNLRYLTTTSGLSGLPYAPTAVKSVDAAVFTGEYYYFKDDTYYTETTSAPIANLLLCSGAAANQQAKRQESREDSPQGGERRSNTDVLVTDTEAPTRMRFDRPT